MDIQKSAQSILKKIPSFRRVVIGVSGGADSIVLAHVLMELGYDITIAHLNHQLRGNDSNEDEAFTMNLAKKWNAGYICERVNIPKNGNLENNARKTRYEFLEKCRQEFNADFIAVAHHFDDQIETVLMHIARGAGLRGQIGMRIQSHSIIRPLLDIRRSDIENYAKDNGLVFRTDKSNFDTNNERSYWRHKVIPEMDGCELEKEIKNISENAKKKLDILSKKSKEWISAYFLNGKFEKENFNKLPSDIKAEILIQILGADDLYEKSINRLLDFINDGQSGKKVKVKDAIFTLDCTSVLVHYNTLDGPVLPKMIITENGITWGNWTIRAKEKAKARDLYVRQWKDGDKFRPSGMNGTKKLQDFFVDNKISRHQRKQIPIIVNDKDDIIAVGNLRLASGYEELKK